MKTYVVVGTYGEYDDRTDKVLYAGNEEFKTDPADFEGNWDEIEMQVWLNGQNVQIYSKSASEWVLRFDKTSEIKNKIDQLKLEIEQNEQILYQLEHNDSK